MSEHLVADEEAAIIVPVYGPGSLTARLLATRAALMEAAEQAVSCACPDCGAAGRSLLADLHGEKP